MKLSLIPPAIVTFLLMSSNYIVFGQVIYNINGPSESNQGMFEVTLEHSVEDSNFDCYFDNAGFEIPIVGNGFEIKNVLSVDPSDAAFATSESVVWQRFFGGLQEDLISGPIVQFEVRFVEEGQFTIGQPTWSGSFQTSHFDNGNLLFQGEGVYQDNLRGVTYSSSRAIISVNESPTTSGMQFASSVVDFTPPFLQNGGGNENAILGPPDHPGGTNPNVQQIVDFGGNSELQWSVTVGFDEPFVDQKGIDLSVFGVQLNTGEGFELYVSDDGQSFEFIGFLEVLADVLPNFAVDVDFNGAIAQPKSFLRFVGTTVPPLSSPFGFDFDAVGTYRQSQLLLGDLNCDGNVNLLDVGPFVDALSDGVFILKGDINQDGVINLLDVGPFVKLLAGN